MLPWKIFQIKGARLAKNEISLDFSLEKVDKNKSARSLALKFGCFKKLFAGLGGQLPPCPPPTSYGLVVLTKY